MPILSFARTALHRRMVYCSLFALTVCLPIPAIAQPSGGPYGPVPQSYAVPNAAHVYYVAPDGKADASGTSLAAPTSIESAMARVVTGDAIVMRGVTYRTGYLQLNQGITIQPYLNEHPVLKGTQVATQWEALHNNVWRTKWNTLFPAHPLAWWRRESEGMKTPLHRFNNDMEFVDGRLLQSAGWEGELDANSFYIDYERGYVYIGIDPKDKLVEITAHDIALHRPSRAANGKPSDGKGPTIRGITFTQYAYRAIDIEGKKPSTTADEEPTDDPVGISPEADHGKEVTGTTLENVTISFTSRVAGYFRGDGLVIRNSLISDTGTEGIYVIASSDVLLERNIVRRNNIKKLTGYYPAAIKIFNQSHRVTVRDNLIIDHPDSNGVWYDVGTVDGVFANNYVEGTLTGLFFEISKGVIAAGNVFVNNQRGVRILNSSNAHVYHNTFFNSPVVFERNERSAKGDHFGWHPSTGPDVNEREGHVFQGNLLVADTSINEALLQFIQPVALCSTLTRPMVTSVDGNAYIRAASNAPLIAWSPSANKDCLANFATLDEFRKATGLEQQGVSLPNYEGAIFRSVELRRFDLAQRPQGIHEIPVAPEAAKVLGWTATTGLPGAYPVVRDEKLPE
jgi:parallel beta-helix repeat protein